ncbi:hypothetical protein A5881_003986 [Enterococcus termitis]
MVGIVYASKFIAGSNQTFQKYIDYIDRSEAVRSIHVQEFNMIDFDGYNLTWAILKKRLRYFPVQRMH